MLEHIRADMTRFLLWLLQQFNNHKDRCLAKRLRDIANLYDPDPPSE